MYIRDTCSWWPGKKINVDNYSNLVVACAIWSFSQRSHPHLNSFTTRACEASSGSIKLTKSSPGKTDITSGWASPVMNMAPAVGILQMIWCCTLSHPCGKWELTHPTFTCKWSDKSRIREWKWNNHTLQQNLGSTTRHTNHLCHSQSSPKAHQQRRIPTNIFLRSSNDRW